MKTADSLFSTQGQPKSSEFDIKTLKFVWRERKGLSIEKKLGEFLKIQEISFPISTKTMHFCEKRAEKKKVNHAYPPWKNDISGSDLSDLGLIADLL